MAKIKVLFLAASPDVAPLQLDEEIREITAKIRAAEHRDSLEIISKWAVRPDDLQQALLEHQPHILHFSGHGSQSEEIILLDDHRKPKPVSKQALVGLLTTLKDNLRLVVLNACYSQAQAKAITEVVDCAVGMQRAIGDQAAVKFAAAFYRAVGFGRSVQTAFELGTNALMLDGIPEETTPQIRARKGVDPAQVFLIPSAATNLQRTTPAVPHPAPAPATPAPNTIRLVRVFVSSPSDVAKERELVDEIVARINRTEGDRHGVRLESFKWEENVVPQIGPGPQPVVDAQTPADYDIYLGILAHRFGTPTDRYGSGTEKEFHDALRRWEAQGKPWILFYFNVARIDPDELDLDEFGKVRAFRKMIEQKGLYATYDCVRGSKEGFYEKLDEHLRQVLHRVPSSIASSSNARRSASVRSPLLASVESYLRRLTLDTATLTLLGMGRSLQVELPIADAYVPLRTTLARSFESRPTDRYDEGHAEFSENVKLSDVFRKATELGHRGVVLLGEPGSGKTTGARQLAWRLASRESLPEDLGLPAGLIPVFLRFRNLSTSAATSTNGLRALLDGETRCDAAPDGEQTPGTDLWNRRDGGLLWILDGLDEVIDAQVRKKLSSWIRDTLQGRPDDWFLVTCRFQGYYRQGVQLGSKFVEFHVRPLDDQQVEQFVRDWFRAAYGKLQGKGSKADERACSDSDALLAILARSANQLGHIRELCTNPLLLTILCIVFHEERKLPTGRAELYGHCVRVLLEYWRRDLYASEPGSGIQPYDAEAAQVVLARLAWWMHQQQDRTSASLDELADEAGKGLVQLSPSSGLGREGRGFLERMRDEAGILAMTGEGAGRCGFLHLSFQEYLAAEHAAREGLARELASRATESWWREVALLSLRRSRPYCEAFFQAMLAAGVAEAHPDLAERCLQEALYFAPGPFVAELQLASSPQRVSAILRLLRDRAVQVPELENLCGPFSTSTDPETRGFATEILVRFGHQPAAIAPQPLAVKVDERNGLTLVWIPAGEFLMGSTKGWKYEQPVHWVRITQGFWLGKYPVTNAQYERYMEALKGKVRKPQYWDNRRFNQPEQPVVGVSWDEVAAYCEWAGGRLPTEAEWEYACRAGTEMEYSFGHDAQLLPEYGWFEENSGGQTQPVGAKKPNPWGLHDMHGNVWEWCQDWYDSDYYKWSPASDPPGPPQAAGRVIRGGSWQSGAGGCRSAYRFGVGPEFRFGYLGFRVAAVPPSQPRKTNERSRERRPGGSRRSGAEQRPEVP